MVGDPLCRCVEVEDDGELARRKRIEEELSQALIRSFFFLIIILYYLRWALRNWLRVQVLRDPGSVSRTEGF